MIKNTLHIAGYAIWSCMITAITTSCTSTPTNPYVHDMAKGKSAEHMSFWNPFDNPNYAEAVPWYAKAVREAPDHASSMKAEAALDHAHIMAGYQAANPGPSAADGMAAIIGGVATGYSQGMAARNGTYVATNNTYSESPQLVAPYQKASGAGLVYDSNLDHCVKLGGDSQSVYFDNG